MDLIAARMLAQGLTEPLPTADDVVKRLVAVQAQDSWVAPYALRARIARGEIARGEIAGGGNAGGATAGGAGGGEAGGGGPEAGGAVVSWLMRGTLHLVAAEDAGWLTGLLGPMFVAKTRLRRLQLGLTDDVLRREVAKIRQALPGTRSELLAHVDVPEGQARAHLLAYAGLTGVMVRRGDTFVPMPPGITPDDPESELARRYVIGYGPAGPQDFAAWSGLPLTTARRVMPEAANPKSPKPPRVKLLGHLDPYLLGYKDRSFALDPAHAKKVNRGGGFLRPIVLVDGRVAGVWSRAWRKERMVITIDAWDPIPRKELSAEVESLDATIDK